MRVLLAVILCATMLSGCASMLFQVDPKVASAQDHSACDGYGYKRGSEAYAECMQLRDSQRQQQIADKTNNFRQTMHTVGAAMAAPPVVAPPPPVPQIVTCNTNGGTYSGGYGSTYGHSTTTCY